MNLPFFLFLQNIVVFLIKLDDLVVFGVRNFISKFQKLVCQRSYITTKFPSTWNL